MWLACWRRHQQHVATRPVVISDDRCDQWGRWQVCHSIIEYGTIIRCRLKGLIASTSTVGAGMVPDGPQEACNKGYVFRQMIRNSSGREPQS